jgi:Fe-S oxidoreductase
MRTMFLLRFEGMCEEYYFQTWAIHAVRMLKEKGIDVEVTYDDYVVFAYTQLTPIVH